MTDSPPAPIEHVVFFSGADGGDGFDRCPSLPAAVARVEELANAGLGEVAVFALLPVPLQVRQVWRVEVDVPGAQPAEPGLQDEPVAALVGADAAGAGADRPGDVLPTQRGRGMGFFVS